MMFVREQLLVILATVVVGIATNAHSNRTKCTPPLTRRKLRNGIISTTDSGFFNGTTIRFTCNKGYKLIGRHYIICRNGRWSSSFWKPYCKAPACTNPGIPSNGWRRGNSFIVGRTVEYHCHQGFTLLGTAVRRCQSDRQWSGSVVVCDDGKSDCPDPGTPINGRRTGSRYRTGHDVQFSCNRGFVLVGSHSRQCLPNRTWSGDETKCVDSFTYSMTDVNTTALNLRKTLDRIREYTCSGVNSSCSNDPSLRMRQINLNDISQGLDVVFAFDGSSSIDKADFQQGLQFAQELVTIIGVSWKPAGTRIAAVCYGTTARLEFNFGDFGAINPQGVIQKLKGIRQVRGGTASRDALILVRDVVFTEKKSTRKRVMFFITDGLSNMNGRPGKVARRLWKDYKVDIYAVGVGRDVNTLELKTIAQEKDHVIVVEDFLSLKKAAMIAVKMPEIDYSPCGESPFDPRARMHGGVRSGAGVWPWQVGIYKSKGFKNILLCGGAILSPGWVITAAHCFYRRGGIKDTFFPESYFIRAGDYDITSYDPTEQDVGVKTIIINPGFHYGNLTSDLALVQVGSNFKFRPSVRPVCLPKKGDRLLKAGDVGLVTGWGAIDQFHREYSKELLQASFQVQTNRTCKTSTVFHYNSTVSFCAGDGKGTTDVCKGDSGGSFVYQVKRDGQVRWVTKGIVSWGYELCAHIGKYSYYTRVETFIDWIKNNIKK